MILTLALAFVLGSVIAAKAEGIDVKVKGQWDFLFGWATNDGWGGTNSTTSNGISRDPFSAAQRVRTQINFIASEYLQGVLIFEIGDLYWGGAGVGGGRGNNATAGRSSGAAIDADGVNVETKHAYLDWLIPNTPVSVRMGIQPIFLPAGPLKNPVMTADVAGVLVSSPIIEGPVSVATTAFWLRPFDNYSRDPGKAKQFDEMDVFGLIVPVKAQGWSVTPWGAYAYIGSQSGYLDYQYGRSPVGNTYAEANQTRAQNAGSTFSALSGYTKNTANDQSGAYWLGLNFELTQYDPIKWTFDAIYGGLRRIEARGGEFETLSNASGNGKMSTRGYFLVSTLDYKMNWGTPGIFGWYASGDSARGAAASHYGQMPTISGDTGFAPSHFGFRGAEPYIANRGYIANNGTGMWGVALQVANMSFIEDLKHTIKLLYYRGTNNSALGGDHLNGGGRYTVDGVSRDHGLRRGGAYAEVYMTRKDSAWEVNFDHEYKIYENLTALLELGYIRLRLDQEVWGKGSNSKNSDNAMKGQLQFRYSF